MFQHRGVFQFLKVPLIGEEKPILTLAGLLFNRVSGWQKKSERAALNKAKELIAAFEQDPHSSNMDLLETAYDEGGPKCRSITMTLTQKGRYNVELHPELPEGEECVQAEGSQIRIVQMVYHNEGYWGPEVPPWGKNRTYFTLGELRSKRTENVGDLVDFHNRALKFEGHVHTDPSTPIDLGDAIVHPNVSPTTGCVTSSLSQDFFVKEIMGSHPGQYSSKEAVLSSEKFSDNVQEVMGSLNENSYISRKELTSYDGERVAGFVRNKQYADNMVTCTNDVAKASGIFPTRGVRDRFSGVLEAWE